MGDISRDRVKGIEARAIAKLREAIEGDINVVRAMYLCKNEDERKRIRNWVSDAADLAARSHGLNPKTILLVEFIEPRTDGDDIAVTITATAAIRAIE
jgi:hypothetical protein